MVKSKVDTVIRDSCHAILNQCNPRDLVTAYKFLHGLNWAEKHGRATKKQLQQIQVLLGMVPVAPEIIIKWLDSVDATCWDEVPGYLIDLFILNLQARVE